MPTRFTALELPLTFNLSRRGFVILGLAASISGCSSFAAPVVPAGATSPGALSPGRTTAEINETRRTYGAAPLGYSRRLEDIARKQAQLMAAREVMSHDLGGNLHDRTVNGGYDGATGENLASGWRTLEQAIAGWLKSPPHRATLLNSRFSEFGLAAATSATGKAYWAFVAGGSYSAWR